MRKLPLPLLAMLLFTSCQKQISTDKTSEEIAGAAANKQAKFTVCHYDPVTKTSKSIEVTQNALAGHLAHGDLQGDCSAVLVKICDQDWTKKNLDVSTYRNGDPIPQVTNQDAWEALTTGAWCYYFNDPANGNTLGKLYNWYAVNDSRGLAPVGWHIPSVENWTTLVNCLGGDFAAGGKMKTTGTIEAGTGLWNAPNTDATNSSGFTGIPSGNRSILFLPASFTGYFASWWSSTEYSTETAHFYSLYYSLPYVLSSSLGSGYPDKKAGFSVRCVRD